MHKANTHSDEDNSAIVHHIEQPPTEAEKKALHFFETGIFLFFFSLNKFRFYFIFQRIPQALCFISKPHLLGFVV